MNMALMKTCIICGQTKEAGIHIFSSFICTECEQEIVHTDVFDVKYYDFIRQMKKIIIET